MHLSASERRQKFKEALAKIRETPESELLLNTIGIDWERISRVFVPSRTPDQCRIQWIGNDDPRINNGYHYTTCT